MNDPLDAMFSAARSEQAEPARDPLDTSWGGQQAGTNILALRKVNPEQAGRANTLSRQTGLPADTVERNLGDVESRQQLATARSMIARYPAIGHWADDPRNAAVGRDDMTGLGSIAKTVKGFLGSAARAVPAGFFDLSSGIYGVGRLAAENAEAYSPIAAGERAIFGRSIEGALASFFKSQQEGGKATGDKIGGAPVANRYARDFISGIRSLPATAGSLAMAAAGAPEMSAAVLGATVGGQEYGRGRDAGLSPGRATAYAAAQGTAEFLGERVPALRYFADTKVGATFGRKLMNNLVSEMGQEQATTVVQDLSEWAFLNPEKPFTDYLKERPDAALSTAIATAAGSVISVGGLEAGTRLSKGIANVAGRAQAAQQAETDAAFLDRLATGTAESKTVKRDPAAGARFLELLHDGTPAENLYIPGQQVAEYFQSNDMDWHDPDHAWDFGDDVAKQIDDSLLTGGDVVVKTSDFMANLAGTPAWDALKDHVRLSAGGESLKEAKDFDAAKDEAMAKLGEDFSAQLEQESAEAEPKQRLYQSIRDKLTNAGYTQSVADTNATLFAQRYSTRVTRMGGTVKGDEFDTVDVQQVLPEGLAPLVAADQLDMVVEAMRKAVSPRSDAQKFGPSLVEWIAAQGGIEDRGGDVASMGGADWHKGKPGKRRLIRPSNDTASFLPGQKNANTPDDLASRAQEAGYFTAGDRPTTADLFAAMGNELSGKPIYAEDRTGAGDALREGAAALEQLLEQRGLDPATASKADIKAAVAAYQQEQVEGFDQSFSDGPRGRITFPASGYGTGQTVIQLFQARDLSTFIHESAHLWLEELRADATSEGAPDGLKADWQAVQDWFAANGHPVVDGVIPVDAHELWARGVERRLMEGKSPSTALRRVFDAVRSWMLSIYQVVDNLRSPITPEIRAVMDRLIATDEEIANAAEQQGIKALFTDAAQAAKVGIRFTEAEFAAYQASTAEARDGASDALLFRTMEAIRRSRTKAWKDERETVEAETRLAVDARPEFRALAALRTKGTKLDRNWLVETYGADALSLLPKGVPLIYAETGGTNADALAELHGFRTGDEMVRALMGIETRKRALVEAGDKRSARQSVIDEETDATMRERHGDPLSDGSIQEEALAAIHSDRQGEVIASEIRALSRKTGDNPTPYRLAREWAARTIAESRVVDATSGSALQRYAKAAAKAAKLAEEAILKGDADETFRQKQAQMLNNALIAEAKKAKDAVDIAVTRLGKLAKRATIKSIDQDYLDQVHGLLEQVNFRQASQRSLDRQESFEEWATARQAEGHDVVVPPSFAERLGTRNWSRLTVEELLGLDETVAQIVHLGRFKQTLLDGKEKREYDAGIGEGVGAASKLPPKPPSDLMQPDWKERFVSGVAHADSALLRMETVFDWLDGGSSSGPFNRYVFRPIAEAQDNENGMLADYYGRIRAEFAKVGPAQLKRWQESFSTPELTHRKTGRPYISTRESLIAMALNVGNEGNRQRLADGYDWDQDEVMAVLNRELSEADWQFVQSVWNIVDTLWPQVAAMERRLNGVAPEKIAASPVETPFGTLAGGYYPAVYDTAKDQRSESLEGKANELFSLNYTHANTTASSTKARSDKVSRPINLQLNVINRHLGEVIHDLTHREAVMQADRYLSDPRIVQAVDDTLGREIRQQFKPWVKFVANSWASEKAGNEGLGKYMQRARSNATVVGMGFRISTMLSQIAGYSNSVEIVGEKWIAEGFAISARNPVKTFNFVMEKSGEVRSRMDTLDRDIQLAMRQLAGTDSKLARVKKFAFHGIGYADRAVVVPTWIGAYNKAVAAGSSDADAIYAGDKAVRQSQGAGSPKDLAAVARGTGKWGELLKIMTMYFSYHSTLYQRQRTLGRDVRYGKPRDFPKLLARSLWLLVIPALASQVPAILAGGGPGDDEDWGTWAFKQILFGNMTIPGIRDLARPVWDKAAGNKGFDYQLSPIQRAGQSLVIVGGDVGKIARGEDTKQATRDTLEAAGYLTGMVPGQVASSTQFLVDLGEGDADPEGVAEWYEGLTTGRIKDD